MTALGPWQVVNAPKPGVHAASQELMEELMGAVVTVDYLLQTLMGLPADALPGENKSEAIREVLTASACRVVGPDRDEDCRAATALIQAVLERMAEDVHDLATLAEAIGQRPC